MSALNVLCAQLTRDLFAIAKFLFVTPFTRLSPSSFVTPFVHCAFACHGNADKEKNIFITTDVGQMHRRRHYMTASGL